MILRSLLMLTALSTAAAAAPIIDCESPGAEPVRLRLETDSFDGQPLSCIEGPFISDMTPCAPNGGWGLSAPTGIAPLTGLVYRWQDYTDHMGGVVGFFSTETRIRFSGGYNSPQSGFSEDWVFQVDRMTATGTLDIPGQAPVTYTCRKAEPLL